MTDSINIILGLLDLISDEIDNLLFVVAILFFFFIDRGKQKNKKRRQAPETDAPEKEEQELRMDAGGCGADSEALDGDQTIVIPDLFRTLPPEETRQHQTVMRDEDWRARQKSCDGKIYTQPQDASADGVTTDDEALAKNKRRVVYDVTTDDEALAGDAHTHTDGMIHSGRRLRTEAPLIPEEKTEARTEKRARPDAQEVSAGAVPVFSDDELVNAVIMSEILGKPKALQ